MKKLLVKPSEMPCDCNLCDEYQGKSLSIVYITMFSCYLSQCEPFICITASCVLLMKKLKPKCFMGIKLDWMMNFTSCAL